MDKVYVLKSYSSDPTFDKGIFAICTSLDKAIELLKESYDYQVEFSESDDHTINIDGEYSNYDISKGKAWITVELKAEPTNVFL